MYGDRAPRSYLILHGIGNERPPEHWQFQLAAELTQGGHEVRYPGLPDPHSPALDSWLSVLAEELNALTGQQRTVICHSLACLLWFHAASRKLDADWSVDRVLLVSPPDSAQVPDAAASFRIVDLDIAAVQRSARCELTIVCSDADPYNPAGAQALYGDQLGIRVTLIPGAGHITPASGYGRWPWVKDWTTA
jgi:uncharacterized protein